MKRIESFKIELNVSNVLLRCKTVDGPILCALFFIGIVLISLTFAGCEHQKPLSPADETPQIDTTLELADFKSAQDCAQCHPNHFSEWSGSMHAYAALDPVFLQMQKMGQQETGNELDQFCVQCHSPIASKLELTPPNYENSAVPKLALEGISCMGCHAVSEVKSAKNADISYNPAGVIYGPLSDPAANGFHESAYHPNFDNSDLCSACHNVINARDVVIENTFGEFETSPAAAQGQQCMDCHMPVYRGQAATGGPERDVHRHYFVGVDLALIDFPDRDRQFNMVKELLRSAASIAVEVPQSTRAGDYFPITVRVTNQTAGHNLPSGATADRQMWLAVTLTDKGTGEIIYQSGHLDANGDLMDRHSEIRPNGDKDLIIWSQQMVGTSGEDVFFSWQAYEERTVTIAPLQTVAPVYDQFLPASLVGPLQIDVKLRFRMFPPFILRKVDLPDLAQQLRIIDMDEWSQEIPVN